MKELHNRLDEAITFAVAVHSGQRRKSGSPYILHPMEAATVAGSITNDEDVIIAALLHDVIEDAGVKPADIEEKFGKRVGELVLSETEDKRPLLPPDTTWEIRKKESLDKVFSTNDEGVKIVWLSDKLSNIRSLHKGVLCEGDGYFNHFNQKDKNMHKWYYSEIAKALKSLENTDAYKEFIYLVNDTFIDK